MSKKFIMVDVEADGPCPGLYSMVSFGAVVCDDDMQSHYSDIIYPFTSIYLSEALRVCGVTREQMLTQGRDAVVVMAQFDEWLKSITNQPVFISDNNGFDWQFINFYFWKCLNRNPFGHSSRNAQDLFRGLSRHYRASFKAMRKTKHTHHPVDDATGNVEAFLSFGKKIKGML